MQTAKLYEEEYVEAASEVGRRHHANIYSRWVLSIFLEMVKSGNHHKITFGFLFLFLFSSYSYITLADRQLIWPIISAALLFFFGVCPCLMFVCAVHQYWSCLMDLHCFRYHGYAYDGIWTVARAIDTVEKESQQANESLVDFKYK